jgi:YidC/Oxa1 family membrane protein insertase
MPDSDKARLWIAVLVSLLILIVWQVWYELPRQERMAAEMEKQRLLAGDTPIEGVSELRSDEASIPKLLPKSVDDVSSVGGDEAVEGPRLEIRTDKLLGSLNLRGGKVDDLLLLDYDVMAGEGGEKIRLLSPSGTAHPYFMQLGWLGSYGDGDVLEVPDHKTEWQVEGSRYLGVGSPVRLLWESGQKVLFSIDFWIDEDYMIGYRQGVRNGSGESVSVRPYGLISRAGTPHLENFYILHEGFIGYMDGGLQEISYSDVSDEESRKLSFSGEGGWTGITDKYWLTALMPSQTAEVMYQMKAAPYGEDFRYQSDMLWPESEVLTGGEQDWEGQFFVGAKRVSILDRYEEELKIPSFDKAVDFGWLYFLTKPIFYLLSWLYEQLGNFGLSILALTVLMKLLFFPLAQKSYRSMSKLKLLQPQVMEMKERYGDDRQSMSRAMMDLYKREKVNPLAGCLPVLLQIPVFFALYKVLFVTIEMRHAPFFGWIADLSAPDPLGILTLFGLISWTVPGFLQIVNIGIWPLIMGGTMWLQQRMQPMPTDPVQARVFKFLPIVFTFMLATFPAGLVIYWSWNNLLSIGQQALIMRRLGAKN